jgi:hypothetical protein
MSTCRFGDAFRGGWTGPESAPKRRIEPGKTGLKESPDRRIVPEFEPFYLPFSGGVCGPRRGF